MSSQVFCDGVRLRDFLAYGVAGAGLSLPAFLQRTALGSVDGAARAKSLLPKRRSEIARIAAEARWKKRD